MSDFKAKMHQIRFPLGLRPRPRLTSLQRSPRLQLYFRGLFLSEGKREREERERKTKVKGTEGETRWREGFGSPQKFWRGAPMPDP